MADADESAAVGVADGAPDSMEETCGEACSSVEVKKEEVAGRYEKHAEYPRNCDNSFWVPGAWANIYQE